MRLFFTLLVMFKKSIMTCSYSEKRYWISGVRRSNSRSNYVPILADANDIC